MTRIPCYERNLQNSNTIVDEVWVAWSTIIIAVYGDDYLRPGSSALLIGLHRLLKLQLFRAVLKHGSFSSPAHHQIFITEI